MKKILVYAKREVQEVEIDCFTRLTYNKEMIFYKKEKLELINTIPADDLFIISNFDGTMTRSDSDTSWGSLLVNPNVPKDFVSEYLNIFSIYHKFEINESMPIKEKALLMNEWYGINLDILKKFAISENMINYASTTKKSIVMREGLGILLKNIYLKNIPFIIWSAGIGNVIYQFLENQHCNYLNISIFSNFLVYENGILCGIKDENIIHPLNKSVFLESSTIKNMIANKHNVLILGNNTCDFDINLENVNSYKIGFLDENIKDRMKAFLNKCDLICTHNSSYLDLVNIINLFK